MPQLLPRTPASSDSSESPSATSAAAAAAAAAASVSASAAAGTGSPGGSGTAPGDFVPAGAASTLRQHLADVVLPLWRQRGFNTALGLPFEAIFADERLSPPAVSRYRAMACARQLYLFSASNDLPHATGLFDALLHRFEDPVAGGFFYSIDASGQPLDDDKDLYTHAFVIFACATYFAASRDPRAMATMSRVAAVIAERFGVDAGHGLPPALMTRDFGVAKTPPRQNPLMHLSEAYLAAWEASGDPLFDRALTLLLDRFSPTFVDRGTGCVAELPLGNPGNWIEPGHQFEWLFLSESSQHAAFEKSGMRDALRRAYRFAQEHGVTPTQRGVVASVEMDGRVRDPLERIWAQTEYLRAMACHPDAAERAGLDGQIALFAERFLHPAGWHEVLDADGGLARPDMPSTTPYHLHSSFIALP